VGDSGIIVPYGNDDHTCVAIVEAIIHMDGSKARERARCFSRGGKQELVRSLIKSLTKQKVVVDFSTGKMYPCEPFEV
jgi:c-di-GMP-related signal transduction protein